MYYTQIEEAPFSSILSEDQQVHNKEMNLAWQFISQTNISVFLTGKAGTGKTTFLRRLYELAPKRMVILAPTGVAAINAHGQTIHSFFQLPFGPNVPELQSGERKHYSMSKEKKNLIRSLDLIVIDEISMVRSDLLDAIDREMRKYRDRNKPFGGAQLLLIGDLQQLAPVAKEDEWRLLEHYYTTPYFFGSKALAKTQYVTIELQHIYRQQDETFINILAQIRNNTVTPDILEALNKRYVPNFQPSDNEGWIRLTTHNNKANNYNTDKLKQLQSHPFTFEAKICNNFPELSYPTDRELTIKIGAQVMFVKNDQSREHAYYNGKIGIVTGFDEEDNIIVQGIDDQENICVSRVTWENTKYTIDPETKEIKETVDGTFIQYPLRLAWAITVHKSQGLTFDHAVVDINQSFAHGQVYVALSRCRTLEGMVLTQPVDYRAIITDNSVDRFIESELEQARTSEKRLPELKYQYYLELLSQQFNFDTLLWDFNALVRIVDEHLYNQYPDFLVELKSAQSALAEDVLKIATRFQPQYHKLLQQAQSAVKDVPLQQRLKEGARYFYDKLVEILAETINQRAINIDNKQISAQYNNVLNQFMVGLNMKLATLLQTAEEGFAVSTYLDSKAKAAITDYTPKANTKSNKTRTKEKTDIPQESPTKRTDSKFETLRLYQEGKTIKEISEIRNLKFRTIESHLGHYIAEGTLDINDFVSSQHQRIIKGIIRSMNGSFTLSDIKSMLPKEYTYMEIKAVVATVNN